MATLPPFIKGLELSGIYYREAVLPILEKELPGLRHGAGLLDYGSDLLGFDTERSMDHGWGPRVMLFLAAEDFERQRASLPKLLAEKLPVEIRGFPTHMGLHADGTIHMQAIERGPVEHRVTLHSASGYAKSRLGLTLPLSLSVMDWLSVPQQRLAVLQRGGVFHDGLGELEALRKSLAWYPHDLWLHLMACQWEQIAQEEPFVARTGDVGDELGSRVLAARLVKQMMQLCFLMEKCYRPYSKWMGTAFKALNCAPELLPLLEAALACSLWQEREKALAKAYSALAQLHNALGLGEVQSTEPQKFHSRPYQVIMAGRFAGALRALVTDPEVKRLPKGLGGIDQMSDNVDLLEDLDLCRRVIQAQRGA